MKVSTIIFWVLIIVVILLFILGSKGGDAAVINILGDLAKGLGGGLVGSLAGEHKNE